MGASPEPPMTQSPPSRATGDSTHGDGTRTDLKQLLEDLQEDRLWLLRQLDSGRWPEWRLDLAALERELGQLLDRASERFD